MHETVRRSLLGSIILIAAQSSNAIGSVLYVDQAATAGEATGVDWCNAYLDLQPALAAAAASAGQVTEIRVAEGTYVPSVPADRDATFALVGGVTLRGGFAGCNSAEPNDRDISLYETILSGDRLRNDEEACGEGPWTSVCCSAHPDSPCGAGFPSAPEEGQCRMDATAHQVSG